MNVLLLDLMALSTQAFAGLVSSSVCILVKDRRILFYKRRWGGARPVSTSSAGVDVVWKHPRIAFIAVLCAVTSLESCVEGACCPYRVGRCHIEAA